jgi:hypothetical protein
MLKLGTKSIVYTIVVRRLAAFAILDHFPIAIEKARTQVKNRRIRAN